MNSDFINTKPTSEGVEACRTYNEILNLPSTQTKQTTESTSRKLRLKKREIQLIKFDKNILFRAALNDDLDSISSMKFTGNDINSCDTFGWSGLMIAACEGSRKVCEFLLNNECDLTITDRSNNSALSLARSKNRAEIVKMIEQKMANIQKEEIPVKETLMHYEPFWCEECQHMFKETSKECHETSTLHRFNHKNTFKFSRRFFIPESNIGFKMMLSQGWNRESGLGPNSEGKLYPVKTTIRKPRSGLGVKQDPARVTHYSAFDRDAIKWRPPAPKAKTKKELEKEAKAKRRKEFAIRRELS